MSEEFDPADACAYFESWGSSVAWRWFLRMWPMSWWRWTCSERGACSLICQDHRVCELRKHFSFLFSPLFEDFSAAQPFLLQQVNNQLVHDFLSQQKTRLFLFLSEHMDLFVAGRDQSAADQPNNLAEGHPPLWPLSWYAPSYASEASQYSYSLFDACRHQKGYTGHCLDGKDCRADSSERQSQPTMTFLVCITWHVINSS